MSPLLDDDAVDHRAVALRERRDDLNGPVHDVRGIARREGVSVRSGRSGVGEGEGEKQQKRRRHAKHEQR
jgi:hypothetical protein